MYHLLVNKNPADVSFVSTHKNWTIGKLSINENI
jgi:hypothetical protein